ncbi:hypothetical protein [Microbacterium sp. NPDC089695]|uniref:hypothetical protein n=1 Tax=Microbacterium sp. NPDC089695 TaxID=3364198 RepID=UPI0037F376DE
MDVRRSATAGLILAAGLAVSGCTASTTDAGREATPSASASANAAETPEPTPPPEAAAEERMLPMPPEDIAEWADDAVPGSDAVGYTTRWSGWMSAHTSPHHTSLFREVAPGTYQGQIACRGEGTISVQVGDIDATSDAKPVVCTNATIAFDAVTTAQGMQVDLALEGDPTIYAVSFVAVG